MDWASRKVLSWRLSNTLDGDFCVAALEAALQDYGCPDIVNTDQGAQFTGAAFIDTLKAHDVQISMDGKGCYRDNILVERYGAPSNMSISTRELSRTSRPSGTV